MSYFDETHICALTEEEKKKLEELKKFWGVKPKQPQPQKSQGTGQQKLW
jgi:hypothetical protein